jgi:hypothetical protein
VDSELLKIERLWINDKAGRNHASVSVMRHVAALVTLDELQPSSGVQANQEAVE